MRRLVWCMVAASISTASAATLEVGPGKPFDRPSTALAATHDGDTVKIDPRGQYDNDVALIDRNDLTIESTGPGRVMIHTDGCVYGKKGIWVFAEGKHGLTVRGVDFSGGKISEADGANAAGLRSQGTNLTVTDCRFHDNQDGILGGYGTTTIEHCEFDHNGPTPLTHNLYVGDQKGTLIFRFNYSHDTNMGHLLKSRAAINTIEYNRLCDEAGTGSYEIDLPNGGRCDVVGNLIHQSAKSENGVIVAYGEEGVVAKDSALNLSHNTIVNDRDSATFVEAGKAPGSVKVVSRNNFFVGPGNLFSVKDATVDAAGDVRARLRDAGFKAAARGDYRLTSGSPAVSAGRALSSPESLIPRFELAGDGTFFPRLPKDPPDAGAATVAR